MKKNMRHLIAAIACVAAIGAGTAFSAQAASSSSYVSISKANFPDQYFRKYVKRYDKNKDGKLSKKEIAAVKTMVLDPNKIKDVDRLVTVSRIKSVSGLRKFTNLTKLEIVNNNIKDLYLNNPKLESIVVNCANMKHFGTSGGDNLTFVYLLSYNAVSNPDFSKHKNLERLYIATSKKIKYENLKITKCKKLKGLSLINNVSAVKVDLSRFPNLEYFNYTGKAEELDAHGLTKMKQFYVSDLGIKTLNVKGCSSLTELRCTDNKLSKLDVTGLSKLKKLNCDKDVTIIGANDSLKVTH